MTGVARARRATPGLITVGVLGVAVLTGCAAPVESPAPLASRPSPAAPGIAVTAWPSPDDSPYVWWSSPAGPAVPSQRVRPRRDLTPGALNPDVTQSTIRSTICVSGWTTTVRPPLSYTEPLKRRQILEYGYADKTLSHYEEDHLVPLELGGAPRDERNLWPEPGASPNPKDAEENELHHDVCAGKISLADAQSRILADWGPL